MATKVSGTINGRLTFLYRKQNFLSFSLRRLLCNALIQPHFDYACAVWYHNLNKRFVKKIQICQNKCIRFCLKLNNRDHVGVKEFRQINWLPTKERFELYVCANIFKFFTNMSPAYTSELYQPFNHGHNTRRSNCRLRSPYRNTSYGHKSLFFLGPKLWNNLLAKIKSSSNINTFKHDIKKQFSKELQKKNDRRLFLLLRTLLYRTCSKFQSGLSQVIAVFTTWPASTFCALVSVCISFTRDHNENKVFAICIMPSLPLIFSKISALSTSLVFVILLNFFSFSFCNHVYF